MDLRAGPWSHSAMDRWVSRLAASVALVAIGLCSGLGLCWSRIACDAHACCADSRSIATSRAKACPSVAVTEGAVKVVPAGVCPGADAHRLLVPLAGTLVRHGQVSTAPQRAAPLILRI